MSTPHRPRWEYESIVLPTNHPDRVRRELNRMGAEGWELGPSILDEGQYNFRRPARGPVRWYVVPSPQPARRPKRTAMGYRGTLTCLGLWGVTIGVVAHYLH